MHPLSFQIKRAHHRVIALGRQVLRKFALTPARFDLLGIVYKRWMFQKRLYDAPAQTDLCRLLGVTAPTVSRMVRSLEVLGIVRRFRNPVDRRTKQVALTDEGLELFRKAHEHAFANSRFELAYQSAFGKPSAVLEHAVIRLKHGVRVIAKAFGDTSTLSYDWISKSGCPRGGFEEDRTAWRREPDDAGAHPSIGSSTGVGSLRGCSAEEGHVPQQ